MPVPRVDVARRRDLLAPGDNRRLSRNVRSGEWVRVAPGSYVVREAWAALTPIERHRLRVDEVVLRLQTPAVVSHLAAAALWDIDVLGPWPTAVDVTIGRTTGGRSGGALRRHALGLDGVERIPFGRHEVTSAAQTALDLARALPFVRAVTAVDQALWSQRRGGPLCTKDELLQALERGGPRRGDVRARRAIDAGEALAANVRETQVRVVAIGLGFGIPRLQERRVLRSGRLVFGDLYSPDHDHWVEIDGRGKYLSPQFGAGRAPADIVLDEKDRENEIRREVRGFSRLGATDADHPGRMYDILTGDGLPSTKPRPRTR
ncbi:hypothetical protein ACFQZV_12100 [Microbacterium koreense]|uniref:Transcriptional regulator, AbiEi antitoxin, Type IV TA system n=1 Tax=Microbacterium koreense TaxID=323761 RepID=A0ABW2ZTU5_9MICO